MTLILYKYIQYINTTLTLPITSYFGPTHYTKGGGGGVISIPSTISSTLTCTNVKFCKLLEIPFKVSESQRLVENFLYGYHGDCYIRWCFSLIFVKMFTTNRKFSKCFHKSQISRCQNKTFCNDSSILVLLKTVILKWVGVPDF